MPSKSSKKISLSKMMMWSALWLKKEYWPWLTNLLFWFKCILVFKLWYIHFVVVIIIIVIIDDFLPVYSIHVVNTLCFCFSRIDSTLLWNLLMAVISCIKYNTLENSKNLSQCKYRVSSLICKNRPKFHMVTSCNIFKIKWFYCELG